MIYILFSVLLLGFAVGYLVAWWHFRRQKDVLETQLLNCQLQLNQLSIYKLDGLGNEDESEPDVREPSEDGSLGPRPGVSPLTIDDNVIAKLMSESNPDSQLIKKVSDVIHNNISDDSFGVDQLCREVGISRVHLNRKLKKLLNVSPNHLILDLRMKYAASLLSDSKLNVGEVAYKLGFSSHSYFSSKFKEYFGVSPTDYEKR